MKPENEEKVTGLPENAYRELKEGESYKPLMSPNKHYPEVTPWSVLWGLVMAVIFSAAAAYLGLKVGQVFEAAIPIAIIAVGLSSGFKRKNALGENVIIQSIGASSGVIVAGAIFTLPALYILQDKYPEITVNFFEVFMSSLLGGIIGILLLIPFRKYFVSDMHGKYPFPEATATTQVLVSGEKGGSQAKPLIFAGLIGGLYDFIIATFGWWGETISTRIVGAGEMLAEKAKIVLKVNTGAAVLGLGYIIGLKYSLIICAGSFLVWLVIIPAMSAIFSADVLTFGNDAITATVGSMSAEQIFTTYARHIGIGGIATAGVIGIINSWGIIKGAVGLAANELKGKGDAVESNTIRTQKDLSMKVITIGIIVSLIVTFLFFQFGVLHNWFHRLIAGRGDRFPVYDRSGKRYRYRRDEPGIGHDAHDVDPRLHHLGRRRVERAGRHGIRPDYRRRGLYGAFHGGRFHYRLKDRLLAGEHTRQARDLEILRHISFRRYGRRRDLDIDPDVRFHDRAIGRSASERYGRRYRAIDEWFGGTLGFIRNWSRPRRRIELLQDTGVGIRLGYVYPFGPEYAAFDRWSDQLVRRKP